MEKTVCMEMDGRGILGRETDEREAVHMEIHAWDFNLMYWAEKTPYKVAVTDGHYSVTYRELFHLSSSLAASMEEMGVGRGDYVFVSMTGCVEFAVVFYAAILLHVSVAAVNPQFRQGEIKSAMKAIKPRIAFVGTEEIAEQLHRVDPELCLFEASFQNQSFLSILDRDLDCVNKGEGSGDDICAVVYTSGSTGVPKFVARSYRAQHCLGLQKMERMHGTEEDVILVSLPLCQQFGQGVLQMGTLVGATVVIMEKFRAKEALKQIDRYQVTLQFGVPTMFLRERAAYEEMSLKPDLSSLRTGIVSGAVSDSSFLSWLEDSFGCKMLNSYGMTETGSLTMPDLNDSRKIRFGTTGRILEGVTLRILDEEGGEQPKGGIGEIVCQTDKLMRGYVRDGEIQETLAGGWFFTGDLGFLDEEGCLTLVGRKRDIIIRGGYNVIPAEIEQVYQQRPDIREICVMGYQDPDLGEKICAFLCLRPDAEPTDQELRSYGQERLAKYKLPDRFIRVESMPHLETEKYNKRILKGLLL